MQTFDPTQKNARGPREIAAAKSALASSPLSRRNVNRLLLGAGALAVGGAGWMARPQAAPFLGGIPANNRLDFRVFRKGNDIGRQLLSFSTQGDRTIVDIEIDLMVKLGPIPVFRYKHRGQEVWDAEGFRSFSSETNDDGDDLSVKIDRVGERIEIIGTKFSGFIPGGAIPTTYWNRATIDGRPLINSQNGTVLNLKITDTGRETIAAAGGTLEANGYLLEGDLPLNLWYDDQGRWVKCAFQARGETVQYELQAPGTAS